MGLIERGVLFQLFWLPAVISAALLLLLWAEDALPRYAPTFAGWCLLAGILQFSARTPDAWVFGLILQTVLAVVLLLKYRLDGV